MSTVASLESGPSISPQTALSYIKRSRWFVSHTATSLGIERPAPSVVAAYALERRAEWAKSTWRQVKAALIYYYQTEASGEDGAIDAVTSLRSGVQSVCIRKSDRTSAMRSKAVSRKDLMGVVSAVRSSGSAYAAVLESWLILGAIMGLRPHEWCQAEVVLLDPSDIGDELAPKDPSPAPYLRVKNSKHTNGRSHGEYRHLNLTGVSQEIIESAAQFSELMRGMHRSGRYRSLYEACRKLLWRVNRQLHKRNRKKWVQLYSPRHRFSSDAKKTLSQASVAAVMGHVSTKTASEHYGRRVSGGSLGPRPVAAEVARVRVRRGRLASALGPQASPERTPPQQSS